MELDLRRTWIVLLVASFPTIALAQKVKVGYDKAADFRTFTSYTWAEPENPPTRPLLYATVIASVDYQLQAKGLARVEKNGALTLIPAGGIEYGFNVAAGTPYISTFSGPAPAMDATMWTGAAGPSNVMAPYVPEGTLLLTFVDRNANKVVWTGTVTEKLDLENKRKSLERVDKAIVKLLKKFPPNKK